MSMFLKSSISFVLITLFLQGCASKKSTGSEQTMVGRMSDPVITSEAVTPVEPVRTARISQDPIPVYHSPKVREIRMDAYVNERGEAFPPSIKYVVEDPGGWNMDALRHPNQAYVPPTAALDVPVAPGMQYTGVYQSSDGSGAPKAGSRLLYNLKDVKITGFTEMSQEARVRGMANSDEAPIFDAKLGWILVPKSVIRGSSPGAKQRAAIPKATPPAMAPLSVTPAPSDFDVIENVPKPVATPKKVAAPPADLGTKDAKPKTTSLDGAMD